MKIYLADTNNTNHRAANEYMVANGRPHRVLWSYYYYGDNDMDYLESTFPALPEIWADSGAFSAFTLGKKEITVRGYADWVEANIHRLKYYANLDEKRYSQRVNIRETLKNQRYLEGRGLKPIPVFHGGEPFSLLEDFVKDYSYIALGGVAGHKSGKSPEALRFYSKCFEIAGDRAVFHGFGMTTWDVMKMFRWYSVDSSSWGSGHRYGMLTIFDERFGRFLRARTSRPAEVREYASVIARYGLDWRKYTIRDRQRPDRRDVCKLSAASWQRAEEYITRHMGEVKIPVREDATGVNLFS